jgi:hypothetical protein
MNAQRGPYTNTDGARVERPLLLFLKAIFHYWWALMSCAAFTFLGIWATFGNKGRDWVLWSSLVLGVVFLLFAAYKAWAREHQSWKDEHQTVEMLTAKPDVTFAVHGIFAHVAQGDQLFVILPDVTVANQSHGLRVAVTADLWMLRSANTETWCSPETKPVLAWEESQHSSHHNIVVLPLNLEPRSAEIGYLAFSHRVLGIGNEPLVDKFGHWRYRIDFRDVHSNSMIRQEEISVSPQVTERR